MLHLFCKFLHTSAPPLLTISICAGVKSNLLAPAPYCLCFFVKENYFFFARNSFSCFCFSAMISSMPASLRA